MVTNSIFSQNINCQENSSYFYLGLFLLSIFPLFPFLSIISFGIQLLFCPHKNIYIQYKIFLVMLSIFLGAINATKSLPGGDLYHYYDYFSWVDNFKFIDFIFLKEKEPLFFALTYVLHYLLNGDFSLYIFVVSFFNYILILSSYYKFAKFFNGNSYVFVFGFFFLAFFPQFFSFSAHIFRQFIANSLILYFIICYIFVNKKKWAFLILSVFIHTTSLFFVPLVLIPSFKNKINLWYLFIIGGIVYLFILNLDLITSMVLNYGGQSFLTYIFIRLSQESFYPLDPLPIPAIVMLIFLILVGFYVMYVSKIKQIFPQNSVIQFSNIVIFSSVFVLLTYDFPEISVRFSFYLYSFVPFVVTFLLIKRSFFNSFLSVVVSIFMILYFLIRLETGPFEYCPLKYVLINPALFFI